jgi:hypothetical protein
MSTRTERRIWARRPVRLATSNTREGVPAMTLRNSDVRTKICKVCQEEKSLEAFSSSSDGWFVPTCRLCQKQVFRDRREFLRELNRTVREPQSIPQNVGPDDKIVVDGLDWTWAFVIFGEIEGFPDYRVSSCGEVWTRKVYAKNPTGEWRRMTGSMGGTNRKYLNVKLANRHTSITVSVHRLVLRTFRGPCPIGKNGLHNNDDQSNNTFHNLRYGTPTENAVDALRDGKYTAGSRGGVNTLTEPNIPEIRRLSAEGWTQAAIADKYGVRQSCISKVLNRERWKHIP